MSKSVKATAIACLVLHLGFFALEAVLFPTKTANFKATDPAADLRIGVFSSEPRDNATSLRVFAFNMGCYNFLIAAGFAYSISIASRLPSEAHTLLRYLCWFVIAAGVVLGLTASWLWIAALAQSGSGMVCLGLMGRRPESAI